jgi:hypothetical protein
MRAMRKVLFAIALAGIVAAPGFAQATRTWVSGVGDDANPCSRTAPCKTFASAISKTAAGGEIDVLDPGAYGAVTITKSITINAEGATAGILAAGVNGVIVNAGANDVVTLRGLILEGVGTGLNGVRFLAGKTLLVDKCHIADFRTTNANSGNGVQFNPSTGISRLVVTNSVIENNGGAGSNGAGIGIAPTGSASVNVLIDNVTISNNLNGIRVLGSNTSGQIQVAVRDSSMTNNTINGFVAISSLAFVEAFLENSAASFNATGVRSDGGLVTVFLNGNLVTGNDTGLAPVFGGNMLSFDNNAVISNGSDGAPTGSVGPS